MTTTTAEPAAAPAAQPPIPLGKIAISIGSARVLIALLDSVHLPGGSLKVQVGMAQTELQNALAPYLSIPPPPANRAARRRA